MILVLQSNAAASLGMDLNVATDGTGLGSGSHGSSDGTTEWLEVATCQSLVSSVEAGATYNVDNRALRLRDVDDLSRAGVLRWRLRAVSILTQTKVSCLNEDSQCWGRCRCMVQSRW